MKTIHLSRRGVAIVIAMFFSFCMLILFVSMMFRQSSTAGHNQLTIQERQAFFAARAAMQHFLLKAKLFPTELYDAVEFAQGKNPLCNFTEFEGLTEGGQNAFESMSSRAELFVRVLPSRELDSDKKIKYYYYPLPGKNAFIRLGSYHNPDYRFLAPGFAVSEPEDRYTKPLTPDSKFKPDKYLKYYIRDCCNLSFDGNRLQAPLEMTADKNIKNINDFDIVTNEGYPYTLNYRVNEVKIQSIKGLRKYGEEAIEVNVEGLVKNFQGKVTPQTQKRVEKITRKGSVE
ncbi:MAG TPA: hypothetical protein PLM07_06880 [Candidatus Rifleibacterium sp.]|nr:hypothetical protein [Candidatus Rifleibacterium sp.]HPT45606.1 hypothetical protein [Candidatus Rifleibacterium sp.]